MNRMQARRWAREYLGNFREYIEDAVSEASYLGRRSVLDYATEHIASEAAEVFRSLFPRASEGTVSLVYQTIRDEAADELADSYLRYTEQMGTRRVGR